MSTNKKNELENEMEEEIKIDLDDNIKEFTIPSKEVAEEDEVEEKIENEISEAVEESTPESQNEIAEIIEENDICEVVEEKDIVEVVNIEKKENKCVLWIKTKIYKPCKNKLVQFTTFIKKYYNLIKNFIKSKYNLIKNFIRSKYKICEGFIVNKLDLYVVQKLKLNPDKFFNILRKIKWFFFSKKFLVPATLILIGFFIYSGSPDNAIKEMREIPISSTDKKIIKKVSKNAETICESKWITNHVQELINIALNSKTSPEIKKVILKSVGSNNKDDIAFIQLFPLLINSGDEELTKIASNVIKLNTKEQNQIDFLTYSRDILNKDNKQLIESFMAYTKYKLGNTNEIYLLDINTVDLCNYYIKGELTEEDFLGFTKKTQPNELVKAFMSSYNSYLKNNDYEAVATMIPIFDKFGLPASFFTEDSLERLKEASTLCAERVKLTKDKAALEEGNSEISNIDNRISEIDSKLESLK